MKSASKKQGIGFLGVLLASLATGCGQVSSVDAGAGVEAASSPGSETGEGHAPSDDAESKIRFGTTDTQQTSVGLIRNNRDRNYERICGGVMIAPNVGITSELCVYSAVFEPAKVSISKVGTAPNRVYPAVEISRFSNLALVKLNQNVRGITFDNVPKIWGSLPSISSSGDLLTAYGFGTDQNEATPGALRKKADFRFLSEEGTGTATFIRAAGQNGAGLCRDDSGGGLFLRNRLLGISQFPGVVLSPGERLIGFGCGQKRGDPSYFSPPYAERKNIANVYRKWTRRTLTFD